MAIGHCYSDPAFRNRLMIRSKSFVLQLIIVGGFLVFFYMFFALATSLYRDYKLESNIQKFEDEINRLADIAHQKPKNVEYYQSKEYRDKYAKENLNLLNPGEKLIIIPLGDKIVKSEVIPDRFDRSDVFDLPNYNQWWEYFFGRTLSVQAPKKKPALNERNLDVENDKLDKNYNIDEESLLEVEG